MTPILLSKTLNIFILELQGWVFTKTAPFSTQHPQLFSFPKYTHFFVESERDCSGREEVRGEIDILLMSTDRRETLYGI